MKNLNDKWKINQDFDSNLLQNFPRSLFNFGYELV